MINILDMIGDTPPERQSKLGTILYGPHGNFFVCAPEKFSRDQKLAFIESQYDKHGISADTDKQVFEVGHSRGLSHDSYNKAREYGLYIHGVRNA